MKFLVLIILGLPLTVLGRAPSEVELQKILRPLKTCPERVWPGYRPFENTDFIITVPSSNQSYIINENGVAQKTAEEWGEEGASGYSYGERNGRHYVMLNFESYEDEKSAIEVLYHESFHFLGQKNLRPTTGRDEFFPVDYDARIARAMQLRNVRDYLESKNKNSLERASYWEGWIKSNRPEENKANQEWDVIEGSAEYVGILSSAISELGCEATEQELIRYVVANSHSDQDATDRSAQSYNAGLLGHVISRLNESNQTMTELNSSPLSTVLAECPQRPEEVNQEVADEVRSNLEPLEAMVTDASQEVFAGDSLVAIPMAAQVGSFESYGFYKTMHEGNQVVLLPHTTVTLSVKDRQLRISERTIINAGVLNQCGSPESYYLVPRNALPTNLELTEKGTYLGKKLFCP